MGDIPDTSNFYSSLDTTNSRLWVADLFRAVGWEVYEPDDWPDYLEVRCDWAELVVQSQEPILMHGAVADVETAGTWFLKNDHRAWWVHSIWHVMVIMGTAFHYVAIVLFVHPVA